MISANQENDHKIINIASKKSIDEESELTTITFLSLYRYFYSSVIFVGNIIGENEQILCFNCSWLRMLY